jgi:hypothetical protein
MSWTPTGKPSALASPDADARQARGVDEAGEGEVRSPRTAPSYKALRMSL